MRAIELRLKATGRKFPQADDDTAELFHRFWDWLLVEKFFKPMQKQLPHFSLEVRVDKEPIRQANDEIKWLGHEARFALPNAPALIIYWAPYWGMSNTGEKLRADESLNTMNYLLSNIHNPFKQPLFIDQFNFVDNSPGFENNASIRADELAAFLGKAVCTFRNNSVRGFALWTGQDYHESPLNNPSFSYGLDDWVFTSGHSSEPALEMLPGGDFQLRLRTGDSIRQTITDARGRLLHADQRVDQVCIQAASEVISTLQIQLGGQAAKTRMTFPAAIHVDTVCADIAPEIDRHEQVLNLELERGNLALQTIFVFDHIQYGGVYDAQGRPGALLQPVQNLNREFLANEMPARCMN